jgi:hypothetical protein
MNPAKLVFTFSDFSVIFYAIYKNQENTFTIEVHLLQQGPWKDFGFRNVVPGGAAGAAPVKFWPVGRRSSPGKDWGRAYGLLGVDLGCWLVVKGRPAGAPPVGRLELASGEASTGAARGWSGAASVE